VLISERRLLTDASRHFLAEVLVVNALFVTDAAASIFR